MTVAAGAGFAIDGVGTVYSSISGAVGSFELNGLSTTFDASVERQRRRDGVYRGHQFTVGGSYDVSGSTQVNGGALTLTGSVADIGTNMNIDDGTVDITTADSLSLTNVEMLSGTLSGGRGQPHCYGFHHWDIGTISGLGP